MAATRLRLSLRTSIAKALIGILSLFLSTGIAGQAPTELEGVWEGSYSITAGKKWDLPPDQVRLTFSGAQLKAKGLVTPDERDVRFLVNSDASPKQFDYWESATRSKPCIYELRGDTLRIAVPTGYARPTAFPSEATKSVVVLALTRKRGK